MARRRSLPDDRILEITLALMHRLGPQAVTFAAVATETGLSGATLVQRFGSKPAMIRAALDLAWTAAGRFDGFWEHGLSPWDMAAGLLMVREAGGFVTDIKGGDKMFETRSIVAGNESIQGQLRKLLANAND